MLQWLQYRYVVRAFPLEIYIGLIALAFAGLGVWAGRCANHASAAAATPIHAVQNTATAAETPRPAGRARHMPHANTSTHAATAHSNSANGHRIGEPISPISLTVCRIAL